MGPFSAYLEIRDAISNLKIERIGRDHVTTPYERCACVPIFDPET